MEPQSYGNPKPVEFQGCGTPELWEPQGYGNSKTVGPQDPINLSSW